MKLFVYFYGLSICLFWLLNMIILKLYIEQTGPKWWNSEAARATPECPSGQSAPAKEYRVK